jgi:hypothetical protein
VGGDDYGVGDFWEEDDDGYDVEVEDEYEGGDKYE